ncbi:hypothetical protein RRG08_015047 [Elysia crispata]|uniref:Uncharacterized protein n=1 Tax=Elysia crispata TaxID=231223 RepID=A0AAE1B6D3_9GAST|nr:hypothetical protein RRG08_015047 [Elysia crispata]
MSFQTIFIATERLLLEISHLSPRSLVSVPTKRNLGRRSCVRRREIAAGISLSYKSPVFHLTKGDRHTVSSLYWGPRPDNHVICSGICLKKMLLSREAKRGSIKGREEKLELEDK